MTTRRQMLFVLGAGAIAAPLPSPAQPLGRTSRIGWLSPGSPATYREMLEGFLQGMREAGYTEGNLVIEYRWADGQLDRLPQFAAELVKLRPDVIVSSSLRGVGAAKSVSSTIPIVMMSGNNPVAVGLVASLARPGGNITGLTNFVEDSSPKLMELIHGVLPQVVHIGVLVNRESPLSDARRNSIERAARALGVKLVVIEVADPEDIQSVFARVARETPGALVVPPDAFFASQLDRIVGAASRNRIPAIYGAGQFSDAGGLMSYGSSARESARRSAYYVDRILKGAKPADLPIEQPTKFELVINMKTARALGIKIPPPMLLQATRVIE